MSLMEILRPWFDGDSQGLIGIIAGNTRMGCELMNLLAFTRVLRAPLYVRMGIADRVCGRMQCAGRDVDDGPSLSTMDAPR